MSGKKLAVKTDGISILPMLLGRGKQQVHDFLYWEFHEDGGRQAVRMGKWKGIREGVFKNPLAAIQLYDLDADPGEKNDLSQLHPELISSMRNILSREHVESQQFPFFKRNSAGF